MIPTASRPTATSRLVVVPSPDAVRSAIHRSVRGAVPAEAGTVSQRPSRQRGLALGLVSAPVKRGKQPEIDVHRLKRRSIGALGDVCEQRPQRGGLGRRRDRLTDATLKSYEADLDRRLDRLMALVPSHPAGTSSLSPPTLLNM